MLSWLHLDRQNWAQWAGLVLMLASGIYCAGMGLSSIRRGPALLARLGGVGRAPSRGQSSREVVAAGRWLLVLGVACMAGAVHAFARGRGVAP